MEVIPFLLGCVSNSMLSEAISIFSGIGLSLFLLITLVKAFGTIDLTWRKKERDGDTFGAIIVMLFFSSLLLTIIAITIQNIACYWIMDCYKYDQNGECILYQKAEFGGSASGYGGYYGLYNPNE